MSKFDPQKLWKFEEQNLSGPKTWALNVARNYKFQKKTVGGFSSQWMHYPLRWQFLYISKLINANSKYFVPNKGSIVNRTYDFSVCGFILTFERSLFLDFSSPLFENRVGNYVNMNKLQDSFDWAFFIRPFNNTSWIFSLGKK